MPAPQQNEQEKQNHPLLYKYKNVECVGIIPMINKATGGSTFAQARFKFGGTFENKYVNIPNAEKLKALQGKPFDMILTGYLDNKDHIQTRVFSVDQDVVKKFKFLNDNSNQVMAQLNINTGSFEKCFFEIPPKDGRPERMRIIGTVSFKKTPKEIEFIESKGPVNKADLYRRINVTLFMDKKDYEAVKDNFGQKSTFYSINVPLSAIENGLRYPEENGQHKNTTLALHVWPDSFVRFMAVDGQKAATINEIHQNATVETSATTQAGSANVGVEELPTPPAP